MKTHRKYTNLKTDDFLTNELIIDHENITEKIKTLNERLDEFQKRYDDIQYTLQSCIIHEGVQWGGHYISACMFNGKWYAQDDEHVFETDLKEKSGYYVLIYTLKNQTS